MKKTNAMRILETEGIEYEAVEYDPDEGIDGISVTENAGLPKDKVFKTLVTEGEDLYVFVVNVYDELDLKKAAEVLGEKKIEMLPLKKLFPETGYRRGGTTAVGMKKDLPVYLDDKALETEDLYVSAGKRGLQIHLKTEDYIKATGAVTGDFAKD